MITCPVCNSEDVCGWWGQQLRAPIWWCRACGNRWPVTPGDGVAAELKAADKAVIAGITELCKQAKWSESYVNKRNGVRNGETGTL